MSQEEKYPYFQKRWIVPLWSLKPEPAYCTPVDAEEFALQNERKPPKLRDQPPPPKAPPRPKAPVKPVIVSLFEAAERFQDWVNSPPAPKPPPAPAAPAIKKPRVKPFDLQDIPHAMRRIGWTKSAQVMDKWFEGPLNYATTNEGATKGINQYGDPFPPSMIDTTMFRMEWILEFPRAKEALNNLRDIAIYSDPAKRAIIRTFRHQGKPTPYFRDGWKICEGNINCLHRNFQFQFLRVDANFPDKLLMMARGKALPNGIFMDDLYGSLGAFSFNAAVGEHRFRVLRGDRVCVEIQEVLLYMRDVFTFHDRDDAYVGGLIGGGSQYLGHWNKTGFILVLGAALASEATKWDWPMLPVARDGAISDDDIYYPVRNKDYRNWQLKHRQGGDLILYSDIKRLKLSTPLVVEFDL
jgi:hypothetical protein